MKNYIINEKLLNALLLDSLRLQYLEDSGVDNWDGYTRPNRDEIISDRIESIAAYKQIGELSELKSFIEK